MKTITGKSEQGSPLVGSQKKKSSHRTRCSECPCQQFQSDDAVASAVNSDARMEALIDWLSGASARTNDGDIQLKDQSNLCPGRIQASIGILNAIRDACRPYLETTTTPSPTSCAPLPENGKTSQPSVNGHATYEESFPSLSSMSSPAAPTMLVGRKKSKGPKSNAQKSQLSSASSIANPTMLVGRKKSKAPKNSMQQPSLGDHLATNKAMSNTQTSVGATTSETCLRNRTSIDGAVAPKPKKKIKPVTISLSTSSSIANAHTSLRFDGNISSLPSQDTSDLLEPAASNNKVESRTKNKSLALQASQLNSATNGTAKVGERSEAIVKVNPDNKQKLERLARIYATVLKSHLAPFLLLELHLLVRLVSLSNKGDAQKPTDTNTTRQYSDLFQSLQSCRDFAAAALTALESVIVNLGHETIKLFATLPALKSRCPELCKTLHDVIHAGNSALIFEADEKALGSTNAPHLTLPFDHARDSRHNYRSPDLNKVFKEREELRDSFLYQLRAFQDVRGKLMEHDEAEKRLASIRHESREMLMNLSPGNTLWFVELFCDLLLQVGLVPISETDSEVLQQIGCEKRLQKLHMRFTSKSGHANKSSRKLRIDQNGQSSNSNTDLPEQCFQGHQEFFSLFLRAGDSYRFNIQLKRQLAQMITERAAVNETKGLCDHMAKTQMLAKYLGLLVFSPNWDLTIGRATADLCSESVGNLPPINVKEAIEDAWVRSRLIAVIPWVVQFLGMMKWDAVSREMQYYIDTFTLLWNINRYCLPYQIERHSYHQTNMTIISLQLDGLFHDVVGLASTQDLPILTLPTKQPRPQDPSSLVALDDLPLWFSKPFLFPSIPHLKDLCELLKDMSQGSGRISMVTRKIRPSTIINISPIPSIGDRMSPWSSKPPGTPKHQGGIKERLVDAFFHQHKDLQQLCDLIVDRAIKNFSVTVSQSCIPPILKSGASSFEEYFTKSPSMTVEQYKELLKTLEAIASKEATSMMKGDFDRVIKGSLHLLAPVETNRKVVDVASSLAINHATEKAKAIVRRIINEEKKKLVDEFVRKEKKFQSGVPLSSSKKGRASLNEGAAPNGSNLTHLTAALKAFHESSDSVDDRIGSLRKEKLKVIVQLQQQFTGQGPTAAAEFEEQVMSMLKEDLSNPSGESSPSLAAAVEVADIWSLLAKLGYVAAPNSKLEALLCDTNNMLTLIGRSTKHPQFLSHEAMGGFLFRLVEGYLVNYRALEKALMQTTEQSEDARLISRALLERLASSRAGSMSATTTIMVRLQKMLLKDAE